MSGKPLRGTPQLFFGATVNPGATDFQAEVTNTQRKIDAGVKFVQTQAIYDSESLQKFIDAVKPDGVAILAGIIPLKSARMATWLNEKVPGIRVPGCADCAAGAGRRARGGAGARDRDRRPPYQGTHRSGPGSPPHGHWC